GRLFQVSNNYAGRDQAWEETGLLFGNAPKINSDPLSSIGSVRHGETIEIDLTEIIVGDGEYSFALANEANDLVVYSSREGSNPPVLEIETNFVNTLLPVIVTFSPSSGIEGTEVVVRGRNLDEATAVFFDAVPATDFSVDGPTQIRAIVPFGASSGKISISDPDGQGMSTDDFTVVLPPALTSFEPPDGAPGTEVTISGSNLSNVAEVSFNGRSASSFQAVSDSRLAAIVPLDATSGPIQISNAAGTAVSLSEFTVRDLPSSLTLLPTDDSFVRSSRPSRLYGDNDELRVRRSAKSIYLTYLKFKVAGLGEAIRSAKLRLFVTSKSDQGGELYTASNDFFGSSQPWNEADLNYENAPELTAGPLADLGETVADETVELDVSSIVTRDGMYTFVLQNNSNDRAAYSSKEGVQPPELFIETLAGQSKPGDGGDSNDDKPKPIANAPVVHGFRPVTALPGSVVTITGSKFVGVTGVAFNDVSTISFVADSPSQIRATVPFGASTGKISVTNLAGLGKSSQDFVVPGPPSIVVFEPEQGLPGTAVTISGSNFAGLVSVTFDGISANFQIDSNSQVTTEVPAEAQSGLIRVSNAIGSAASQTQFTVLADTSDSTDTTDPTDPTDPNELTIELMEDSYVRSNRPARVVGSADELRVRRSSGADYNSYLKFRVSGLSESVRKATLKLFVIDGSSSGGEIYSVSNSFKGSTEPWDEAKLNFENAPALDGGVLSSINRVEVGTFAEFDVTTAIVGDGIYSFAISNDVNDLANFSSKEGEAAPELIIETGEAPSNAPVITGFSPGAGTAGTEVTIFGENFIGSISSGKRIEGTVKIMPLGNSITQGVHGATDDAGYRNDLAELLNSQDIDFNFVGSKRNGRGFDRQHEGHSGFRADELLAEVDAYLRRNPPDMILLHIGTNDISEKQSNSSTIDEISEILDRIHDFNSDIVTILSSIVPRRGTKNSETDQLNNLIGRLISEKQADGYNLHYAGNNEAFVANPEWETEYMDDNVHPNDLGYAVMAGVWLDSIADALGGGTSRSTLAVAFDGQPAARVIIDSKTQIRAKVPAGANSGRITVTTKHGTASSPTNFEVVGSAALAVTFPRGGELWQPGSTHSIVWNSAPDIDRVNLEYSPDAGKSWLPIMAGAANTGRYIWQTPEQDANAVLIRISDFGNGGAAALSKGTLALVSERKAVELLGLNQIRKAALGKLTTADLALASADLNRDGNVNLLDVLSSIDYGDDSFGESRLGQTSDIEPNASARLVMEDAKRKGNMIEVPFTLDSSAPIRGFQIKLRYDGTQITDIMPYVDSERNLILDYEVRDGEIEVMAYLKKENSAVQMDGILLTLTGRLQRPAENAAIEVIEGLFVSRNLKTIPLEAEAESASEIPAEFQLFQNFPNPFNLGTRITFNVPSKSKVSLKIYNLRGELVRTLVNEEREPGLQTVSWNGSNESGITVASGVYVYRLSAGNFEDTRKLTLVK
ncbi:DNRLRE domain-containing protein, partial [bacterium]|nr:DNRLRE domain-containing protein [bacterium]